MRELRLSALRANEALQASEMRHRLLFEGSRDAMMTFAPPSWKFTSGNPAALEMFGARDVAEFTELGLRELLPEQQPDGRLSADKANDAVEASLRNGSHFLEWTHRRLNGVEFPASVLFTRINMAGESLIQANVRDITERRKAEEALARQAAHDSLTGLANRTLFIGRLTGCIERNQLDSRYVFGVLFLDLDRFKVINDSLGHVAGDHLLVEISRRLAHTVRSSDLAGRLAEPRTVARLGGDEFAVLIEDIQSVENAQRITERVQRDMSRPFLLEGHSVFITFSIGVALSNDTYKTAEEVLRDADIAMYAAKNAGKARFAVFDPSMRARAIARLEIETDLRRALTSRELVLHYQPEIDLRSGEIIGFEALVRWQHPKYGIVPPLDFIPIAEETGLIAPLGAWVLEEACSQMRRWHRTFPDLSNLRISVNISGKQLVGPGIFQVVEQALQVSCLRPECLDLEITETVLMDDTEAAIETLLNLKGLGIGLQIDDFGTGYSSLSCLHRLPFDTLKIDRSFVHSMDVQEDGIEIVRTIMALAQSLRLRVIAEGVENPKQLFRLLEMGCGFGQGNHFFKPMDSVSAEKLLTAWSQTGKDLSEFALVG
jgi:diguanylate cyclase (GGDEF)-like protein/PAS domain S-box-containing protein